MILSSLSKIDKAHWELHLNAVAKDMPSLKKEVGVFLTGGELPKLGYPSYIHDWLEKPEERAEWRR
ncbi:hypothetical protein LCGC14_2268760 [marine sediment metagenome]|uniref:Uncharacterized protein n=1 Tax=marine sediment metagenome TaxID=412755 RepID=A0A0F9CXL5_9ZZZZ